MKHLGIAVLSLILGIAGAFLLHRDRDSFHHERSGGSGLSPDVSESESGEFREEVLASVRVMQHRIEELERELAEAKQTDRPAAGDGEPVARTLPVGAPLDGAGAAAVGEKMELNFDVPLDPYGEWWDTKQYGRVWQPDVEADGDTWAPYTEGQWQHSDVGWSFVSEEPWGWATYHYGRWAQFENLGWCWVPGEEWAPAWVSWRTGDTHVGWAPLPPEARWDAKAGIGEWVDTLCDIEPSRYHFVPVERFGGRCQPWIVDRQENIDLFSASRNITDLRRHVGRQGGLQLAVCNAGPAPDWVGRHRGHPFPKLVTVPSQDEALRRCRVDLTGAKLLVKLAESRVKRTPRATLQPEVEPRVVRGSRPLPRRPEPPVAALTQLVAEKAPAPVPASAPLNVAPADLEMASLEPVAPPLKVSNVIEDQRRSVAEATERRQQEIAAAIARADQQRLAEIKRLEGVRMATARARTAAREQQLQAEREQAEAQRSSMIAMQQVEQHRRDQEYARAQRERDQAVANQQYRAEQERQALVAQQSALYFHNVRSRSHQRLKSSSATTRQTPATRSSQPIATGVQRKVQQAGNARTLTVISQQPRSRAGSPSRPTGKAPQPSRSVPSIVGGSRRR